MKFYLKSIGLTFFIFTFLALIPMSCGILCEDSCGCSPSFPQQEMIIRSMEVLTIAGDGQRISPTNSQPYNQVVKAFRVKEFDLVTLSQAHFGSQASFGSVLACSPLPILSKEDLKQLQITNLQEVTLGDGTVLRVGEDITAYFGMNYFFAQSLESVPQFLGQGKPFLQDDFFKIGFTKDPGRPVVLEFNLRIALENGREFVFNNQIHSIQ